jgi:hypothetical protein
VPRGGDTGEAAGVVEAACVAELSEILELLS